MYQFSSSDAATTSAKCSPSSVGPSDIMSSSQSAQMTAAMNFFARAGQKIHGSSSTSKKKRKSENKLKSFNTSFQNVLKSSPPLASSTLFQTTDTKESNKIKVLLRVVHLDTGKGTDSSCCVSVDQRRKQVTLFDPGTLGGFATPSQRRSGTSLPKLFAFDAVFNEKDSLTEICCNAVTDIVQAVVGGVDGCVFSFGQNRLGKSFTMIGTDSSSTTLGIIPCAIAWLFQLINEQKEHTGARFSVRVSAVEIYGKEEKLKDLLSDIAAVTEATGHTAPGVYLRDDPISGTQIENQSELRAPSAEKAAFYLDAALSQRSSRTEELEDDSRNTHLLFTLHIYQYRIEKNSGSTGVTGGRSRLHLIDLGSGRSSNIAGAKDGGTCGPGSADLSLSLPALGSVIMALVNGQRHIPYRDSKTSQLLREALGSLACRVCMIAHVSSNVQHYSDTLQVVQLASKIQRLRRRHKVAGKLFSVSSSSGDENGSCDSFAVRRAGRIRPPMGSVLREGVLLSSALTSSENEYTSSSEQSCDTVIYLGGRAGRDFRNDDKTSKKVCTLLRNKLDCDSSNSKMIEATIPPVQPEPEIHETQIITPQLANSMTLPNKSSEEHSISPRTNAKSRSKMKKRDAIETLSTQKEQWVDGPHAFYCPTNHNREEVLATKNCLATEDESAEKFMDRLNIPQHIRKERRQSTEAVERPVQLAMVDAATQSNKPFYSMVNKNHQSCIEESCVSARNTLKSRKAPPMDDNTHYFQRKSFPIQPNNYSSSYVACNLYLEDKSARPVDMKSIRTKPFVQDWVAKHSVISSVESNICAAAEKAIESQYQCNSYQYSNSESNFEEKHYFASTHSSPVHTHHRTLVATSDELQNGKSVPHSRPDIGILRKHFQKPFLHQQQTNQVSTNFSRVAEWVQSVANDSNRAQSLSPSAIENNIMNASMSTVSDMPLRSNEKIFAASSLDRRNVLSQQLFAYRGVRNTNKTASSSQVTSSVLSETDHEMERVWFSSTGEHNKQSVDLSGIQARRIVSSQQTTFKTQPTNPLLKSTCPHRPNNVSIASSLTHCPVPAATNPALIHQTDSLIPPIEAQQKLLKKPTKDEFHETSSKVSMCKNSIASAPPPSTTTPSSLTCGNKTLIKSIQLKEKDNRNRSESVSSVNSSHSSKGEVDIEVKKNIGMHSAISQLPVVKPVSTKDPIKRDRTKDSKHRGKDSRNNVVAHKDKDGKQLMKDHHHHEHQRSSGSRFMELSGRGSGGAQGRGHSLGAEGVFSNHSHHKKSTNSSTINCRILSPYHTVTQPRISVHSSSGHGSDYSSLYGIKSRTGRKMRHGGTSSGYESILRDSEASSHNDSASESSVCGVITLAPVCSSSSSSRSRSRSAPPNSGDSEERTPSVISVKMNSPQECLDETTSDADEINQPPKLEETEEIARQIRREKISDKLTRLDNLKIELIEAKELLMVDRSSWTFDLHVTEQMDPDHPGFLEALDKELEVMKKRVDACKSHIMMITTFDIKMKNKKVPSSALAAT